MQRTEAVAHLGGHKRRWVHVDESGALWVYAQSYCKAPRKLHRTLNGRMYYRYYGGKTYVRIRIKATGRNIT